MKQNFSQTAIDSSVLPQQPVEAGLNSTLNGNSPLDLLRLVGSSNHQMTNAIAFVDKGLSESLVGGIKPGTEVHFLDSNQDAVTQITEVLLAKQGISSLHIISHGQTGSLEFASGSLNDDNISNYTEKIKSWSQALTADADILLYGCNIAKGTTGINFVQELSQLTGADVAASNDLTGSSTDGGNWVLETVTGQVEASSALGIEVMKAYKSVLASAGDVIINEFSQGSTGAKEWVEILVVKDNLDLQNHRIVDGNGSLNLTLSGSGFSSLKAGTLIVLYNGDDIDSTITPDLSYDPTKEDYTLQISSRNSSEAFSITRNIGWDSTTEAFDNSSPNDRPRILDANNNAIYTLPKATPAGFIFPLPGRATAFTGNSALAATQAAGWSDDYYSAVGNPGLGNGGANTAWIYSLRGNKAPILNTFGAPTSLPAITKNIADSSNTGILVSELIKQPISDANNNTKGLAITQTTGDGNWQYSLDGDTNWVNIGQTSDSSATVLSGITPLYTGSSSTPPNAQGWLQFGASPPISPLAVGGNQTITDQARLVSTANGSAGYSNYNGGLPTLLNPAFPALDRNKGFTLSFDVKINSENHGTDNDRAGFSVIVVTSDKTKAIELGFWQNEIWAQTATPLFTRSATERVTRNTTSSMTRYDLRIKGDTYQLFAGNEVNPILTGSLRDYTAFNHLTAGPLGTPLPYDPYERENFIFLGDNTSRASADVSIGNIQLVSNAKIRFVPNANYSGNATMSFRAWDGTDGSASGSVVVNSTIGNAFSTNSRVASIIINPVTVTGDFTGDSSQDILQRNLETGAVRIWKMNASGVGETVTLPAMDQKWQIAGTVKFNNDKTQDILWYNPGSGENQVWLMDANGAQPISLPNVSPSNVMRIEHVGDFDGDGDADILWRNNITGDMMLREITSVTNNTITSRDVSLPSVPDNNLQIELVADFDGDKDLDILWRNRVNGYTAIWEMNGVNINRGIILAPEIDINTKIAHIGNFDGDRDLDILWYNTTSGFTAIWEMDGVNLNRGVVLPTVSDTNIKIRDVADFDNDGDLDILWYNMTNGYSAIWEMSGVNLSRGVVLPTVVDTNIKIQKVADIDSDGDSDILWFNSTNGFTALWKISGASLGNGVVLPTQDTSFQIDSFADVNNDGKQDIVWYNSTSRTTKIWLTDGTNRFGDEIILQNV